MGSGRKPRRLVHVVLDNLSAHNNKEVDQGLAKHPNVTFHITPTGRSWISQIRVTLGEFVRLPTVQILVGIPAL